MLVAGWLCVALDMCGQKSVYRADAGAAWQAVASLVWWKWTCPYKGCGAVGLYVCACVCKEVCLWLWLASCWCWWWWCGQRLCVVVVCCTNSKHLENEERQGKKCMCVCVERRCISCGRRSVVVLFVIGGYGYIMTRLFPQR